MVVKFEVVEKPNDWTKEIKRTTNNSPTHQARYDYWVAFNDYAFKDGSFAKAFKKRKATTDHWMSLSVGSSACEIVLSQVRKFNHVLVEWYIYDDKELYQRFYSHKDEIENQMGILLEWNELPNKKASRIIAYKTVDFDDKQQWNELFSWMMEIAVKMKNVFKKYL